MTVRSATIPITGLVIAEFLSLLGNQVTAVAIPILVLQHTQSPLVTGIAGAGNVLPIVIAALIGGRAIDRFGAWPLSVVSDLLSCISVLALPLAFIYFTNVSSALIFLLVFLGALFDPTGIAARQTLVPGLTRLARQPLERINTVRGGLENGADFIGPIIAVGLIATIGNINTFFANAASFLFCAVIFALAIPRRRTRLYEKANNDVLSGARLVIGEPQLRALAVMGMIANFVILPFLALLLPVLATQVFGNATLLGICLSVFGICAAIGALSFSKLSRFVSRSLIFYGGLLIAALAFLLCGITTIQSGVAFSSAVAGLSLGASNPLEQTILQEKTSRVFAGRVFTSLTAIRFAGGPVGLVVAGVLTEFAGVNVVLVLSGSFLVIAAIVGWCVAPLNENPRNTAKES